MPRLVLIGAGGYAREVAWLVEEANRIRPTFEVVAFLIDDGYDLDPVAYPHPVVRGIDAYDGFADVEALCCIANPRARRTVVERLASRNVQWATLVHPEGRLGTGSRIGKGSIVGRMSGCTVNVTIGCHAQLNDQSGVGHDTRIGDFFTLSSFAEITGQCNIEDEVFVGSHAVIIPRMRVGYGSTIGAGSVVVRHVPAGVTVFGNPAKLVE